MKKIVMICACAVLATTLVGAGCKDTSTTEKTTDTKNADAPTAVTNGKTKNTNTAADIDGKEPTKDELSNMEIKEFKLSAEAVGENTVHFEWDVPKDIAGEAEGYRFLRGEKENPTDPASWWWERGPAHRELDWKDLPKGNAHFRVCIVKEDTCTVYSNDVEVEVK